MPVHIEKVISAKEMATSTTPVGDLIATEAKELYNFIAKGVPHGDLTIRLATHLIVDGEPETK